MSARYILTDAHRAQLAPWAARWIDNAMRTRAMDESDRTAMRAAIRGMYVAAKLEPPPNHRIVFVSSPFIARFSAGFAAAIWAKRRDATRDATADATDAATRAATSDATLAATRAATDAATDAATAAATRAATRDATDAAIGRAWYCFPISTMVRLALKIGVGRLGLVIARDAGNAMWNGGNAWSGWVSYLSFFRYVARIPISYQHWEHYEQAAIHGSHRYMHEKFCIISDFPEVLTVDDQRRPHAESGPFCRWRDGSALYAWHGAYVPAWIIEHPERMTVQEIQREENVEIRRVMIQRYGQERYLVQSGAKKIHEDQWGILYSAPRIGDTALVMVHVTCPSTARTYMLRVPPAVKTAREGVAWSFGMKEQEYAPEVER